MVPARRTCAVCGNEISAGDGSGRRAKYCSGACRQRAFRQRAPLKTELPEALDSFVGRAQELKQLRALTRAARLVTLVGPGGVGKTRLALDFAAGQSNARLVELASTSTDDLSHTAMAALGIPQRAGEPALKTLLGALGQAKTLIVLDNCEHLVDRCAPLADSLLRNCPGLRILATSRQAIRVPGEVVLRVGGLSLPPTDAGPDPAVLLRSDAVRLFVERAKAQAPEFELTPAVAEIVRRLDGLPLAIELATQRVNALGPEQILTGLDDQLALLTDGSRTAPGRHRELRATIEWSYRLLEPVEQALFRRISVFAGGFGIAAATAVCAGGIVPSDAIMRLVCALVDKSLVVPAGQGRFRQLHSIRAFGLERLAEAGESEVTRDRMHDWLTTMAEPVTRVVFGDAGVQGLVAERENLVAALDHTDNLLLTVALAKVWFWLGQVTTARAVLADAPARSPESDHLGVALAEAARLACWQADYAEGCALAIAALRVERQRDDPITLVKALEALAFVLMYRKDFRTAVAAYEKCVELTRKLGHGLDTAMCQHNLAWALVCRGDPAAAAQVIAECLPVLRAEGSSRQLMAALHTQGAIHTTLGDLNAAEQAFTTALHMAPPSTYHVAYPVEGLAMVALQRGDPWRTLCLLAAAAQLRRSIDVPAEDAWQGQVDESVHDAKTLLGRGKSGEALAAGRKLRASRLPAYALGKLDKDNLLTGRENQVAALVAEGLTNQQIAARLQLSLGTIATHLNSIRNKLGVRSRTQIALWLVTHDREPIS